MKLSNKIEVLFNTTADTITTAKAAATVKILPTNKSQHAKPSKATIITADDIYIAIINNGATGSDPTGKAKKSAIATDHTAAIIAATKNQIIRLRSTLDAPTRTEKPDNAAKTDVANNNIEVRLT